MDPMGLLLMAVGAFAIICAIGDWDWFMTARKARFMVKLLTRNGTRVFYALLGTAIFTLGALGTFGLIDLADKAAG